MQQQPGYGAPTGTQGPPRPYAPQSYGPPPGVAAQGGYAPTGQYGPPQSQPPVTGQAPYAQPPQGGAFPPQPQMQHGAPPQGPYGAAPPSHAQAPPPSSYGAPPQGQRPQQPPQHFAPGGQQAPPVHPQHTSHAPPSALGLPTDVRPPPQQQQQQPWGGAPPAQQAPGPYGPPQGGPPRPTGAPPGGPPPSHVQSGAPHAPFPAQQHPAQPPQHAPPHAQPQHAPPHAQPPSGAPRPSGPPASAAAPSTNPFLNDAPGHVGAPNPFAAPGTQHPQQPAGGAPFGQPPQAAAAPFHPGPPSAGGPPPSQQPPSGQSHPRPPGGAPPQGPPFAAHAQQDGPGQHFPPHGANAGQFPPAAGAQGAFPPPHAAAGQYGAKPPSSAPGAPPPQHPAHPSPPQGAPFGAAPPTASHPAANGPAPGQPFGAPHANVAQPPRGPQTAPPQPQMQPPAQPPAPQQAAWGADPNGISLDGMSLQQPHAGPPAAASPQSFGQQPPAGGAAGAAAASKRRMYPKYGESSPAPAVGGAPGAFPDPSQAHVQQPQHPGQPVGQPGQPGAPYGAYGAPAAQQPSPHQPHGYPPAQHQQFYGGMAGAPPGGVPPAHAPPGAVPFGAAPQAQQAFSMAGAAPPMAGGPQGPMQPGMGPGMQGPGAQQQQMPRKSANRIDPNQIPSPIAVMDADSDVYSGRPFQSGPNAPKSVPPLVTSDFIGIDEGNSNPRFVRMTLNNVPATEEILKKSRIPLAAIIQPLAVLKPNETPVRVVDHGPSGPVRCNRCKAYMNPHMSFIDGGRRFACNMCKFANEVPPEYFCNLDHMGRRHDVYDRPELLFGTVEFVATKEYCARPPHPPSIVFMIDVSFGAAQSGLIRAAAAAIRTAIAQLPRPEGHASSPVRVGIAAFDKALHFFNLKSTLSQAQMLVVSDIDDVFVPIVNGFLVNATESREIIENLLDALPAMFEKTRVPEPSLGAAVQAGFQALKEHGGRLVVFQSALPTVGPGALKTREVDKLLNTDKERTLFAPQDGFYKKVALECAGAGVAVDLLLCHSGFIDVASIGVLSNTTGGELIRYAGFNGAHHGEVLARDVTRIVSRPFGSEALMRVRCSAGLRVTDMLGNFFMRNATDMEIAGIDADAAIAVQLQHDEKLDERGFAYLQAALLYTTAFGERRVRVHNVALKCCGGLADVFRNAEMDSIINYFARAAAKEAQNTAMKTIRDNLIEQAVEILACYRINCATASSAGQLILPEALKLMPVYLNAVLKHEGFRSGVDVTPDERMTVHHYLLSAGVQATVPFFYPRLVAVSELVRKVAEGGRPQAIRASYERLMDDAAYIVENGTLLVLWLGRAISSEWLQLVFAVNSLAQVDVSKSSLPALDNDFSRGLRQGIEALRAERSRCMRLQIVRQKDVNESTFLNLMAEDKSERNADLMSYVDFLCHIHRQIQQKLQ